jgi:BirA family transcriptional regulator, biotin operon repressor / biotin---[acetyl-CoA-carboxylase] ligase
MTKNLLLNEYDIVSKLTKNVNDQLAKLYLLESTTSTNDQVMQSLQQGNEHLVACVANHQTAGRGRDGKTWQSPSAANIYMSVGVIYEVSLLSVLNGLSLACGVALARLLNSMGLSVGLKWPNDILIDDKKLAGILVETRVQAKQVLVVVGVGLNVKMPECSASKIEQPWTDLNTALASGGLVEDCGLNRNALSAQLLNVLIECLLQYKKSGFEFFAADWEKFDVLTGRNVSVKINQQNFNAKVLGFDKDYAIRLKLEDEVKSYYAADIKLKL